MKKIYLLWVACLVTCSVEAASHLDGFYYQSQGKPTGWEWQSPDSLTRWLATRSSLMRGSSPSEMWKRLARCCQRTALIGSR